MTPLPRLVLRSARAMVRAPARWGPPSWACVVALASAGTLAWFDEDPLQRALQGRGGGFAAALASWANLAGSGYAVTLVGVAALLIGRGLSHEALAQAARVLAAAGLWAFLLVRLGGFVLAQARPIEGGAMRFFALGGHGISGHTAASTLFVLPVRDVWLRAAGPRSRNLATAALVAWALLVGWSRVWMGMHFGWQVVAGFAVGLWTSGSAVSAWSESEGGARALATPP